MMTVPRVFATSLTVVLLVSGCGTESAEIDESTAVIVAQDDTLWPTEDVTDWLTHGSQVSLVEVVGEREHPLESESGEGYQARTLQLKILRTVWTATGHTPAEETIDFLANGWAVSGDQRVPFVAETGIRLEVGGTYLMPLTMVDGEWAVIGFESILPVVDDRVSFDSSLVETDLTRFAAGSFAGQSVDEVAKAYLAEADRLLAN